MKIINTLLSRLTQSRKVLPVIAPVIVLNNKPVEHDPFDTASLSLSDDFGINPYEHVPNETYQ